MTALADERPPATESEVFGTAHLRRAANAVREVDPIVEPERRAVDVVLRRTFRDIEASQHDGLQVRAPVAVSILEIENIRRGCDEHAAAPRLGRCCLPVFGFF